LSTDTTTDYRALAIKLASTVLDIAGYIDPDVETTVRFNAYLHGDIGIQIHRPSPKETAETLARRLGLSTYALRTGGRHEWSGTIDGFRAQIDWLEPEDKS
jgi:hypothetical protein